MGVDFVRVDLVGGHQILNLIMVFNFYFVNQPFTGEQKQEGSSRGKYNVRP